MNNSSVVPRCSFFAFPGSAPTHPQKNRNNYSRKIPLGASNRSHVPLDASIPLSGLALAIDFFASLMGATVHLVTTEPTLAPVKSDLGLAITPTVTMADAPAKADVLFIGGGTTGFLAEWQPALGAEVYRTGIDAALVEVSPADAIDLRRDPSLLPTGVGSKLLRDLPITLRRDRKSVV